MQKLEAADIRKRIFGVLLRNARTRAGMTIKEAAETTGFSSSAISDYEYGRRDISLPQLEVFAYSYRVPITYFWSDSPIPDDEDQDLPVGEAMALRRRIIGVLLRQVRVEGGYSQKDLALQVTNLGALTSLYWNWKG
jgi:transcriptional regulator with XRE-family HTH domain